MGWMEMLRYIHKNVPDREIFHFTTIVNIRYVLEYIFQFLFDKQIYLFIK
uniref:Uncharacterized protein n=1 Tax=viral metagenome TaxID=1070528 RepID=A0A6C0C9X2_9ZZZZ